MVINAEKLLLFSTFKLSVKHTKMTLEDLQSEIQKLGLPATYLSVNGRDTWGINLVYYSYNNKWRLYSIDEHGQHHVDENFVHLEDAFDRVLHFAKREVKRN